MKNNAKVCIEWTTSEGRTIKHELEYAVPMSGGEAGEQVNFEKALAKLQEEIVAKWINW